MRKIDYMIIFKKRISPTCSEFGDRLDVMVSNPERVGKTPWKTNWRRPSEAERHSGR